MVGAIALLGILSFAVTRLDFGAADQAQPASTSPLGDSTVTLDSEFLRDAIFVGLPLVAIVVVLGLVVWSQRRSHRETVMAHETMRRELDSRLQTASAALAENEAAVRRMWRRLDSVREEERRRIARDLHDDLSATLVALQLEMSEYTGLSSSGKQARQRRAGADLVDGALRTVHSLVSDIRASLDVDDPWAAIRQRVRQYERVAKIQCQLEMPSDLAEPPREAAIAIYRLVEEALANVVKHSGASRVVVKIHSTQDGLVVEVSDDGCGIDPDREVSPDSFGLIGMRERAESIGGKFHVGSGANGGTTVRLQVPRVESHYAAIA